MSDHSSRQTWFELTSVETTRTHFLMRTCEHDTFGKLRPKTSSSQETIDRLSHAKFTRDWNISMPLWLVVVVMVVDGGVGDNDESAKCLVPALTKWQQPKWEPSPIYLK